MTFVLFAIVTEPVVKGYPCMNSPNPILVSVALLLSSPALSFPDQVSEEQLLENGKSTPVSQIEQGLPDESMEVWLGPLVGKDADWTWELNDCGEQTGNPEIDKNRDMPICAGLEVIDGGRKIYLYFLVGFSSTGLTDSRDLYFVSISELGIIKAFDGLSSLAAHLRIEQAEYTDAELHFASLLDKTIREDLVSRMTDSGLAPTDAESVADVALLEYAKCSVAALGQVDNPTADALLSALIERLSAEELDTRLQRVDDAFFADFIIEWSALTEPCRKDVNSRLGIPPDG